MRRTDEGGYTLIETAIASTILVVVVLMTYTIGTQIIKTTVHGTITGVAAETAQQQVGILEQYIQDAITPASAAIEYPSVSNLCSGASYAAVTAYDYQLELCTSPSSHTSCTSSNSASTGTQCPQLYLFKATGCSASKNQCTLEIQDMSVTGNPVVWSMSTFRCSSTANTCQDDLTSTTDEKNGATPSFPYLFTYFNSTGTQIVASSSNLSSIQSIHLDLENDTSPASPSSGTQLYTEIQDAIFLTGAAPASA